MVAVKCAKCGANIPDKAAFCPACGAKKEEQESHTKATAPATKTEPKVSRSIQELMESLFTEKNMFIMIPLGILIACIGGLLYIFSGSLNVIRAGLVANVFGCLLIGFSLLMGGITFNNYEKFVRLGMIVGGIIMITWTLSIPA